MNEITRVEGVGDFELYNPILILNEDIYFDNRFCVLNTNMGNIAFSYYELGVAPSAVIHNTILFWGFGQSYYVIDLNENRLLYQSNHSLTIIYEIVKCNEKSCVIFIGELSLLCFSLEGRLIWESNYRYIIYDWVIAEEGMNVVFENGEKMFISFENGNGVIGITDGKSKKSFKQSRIF